VREDGSWNYVKLVYEHIPVYLLTVKFNFEKKKNPHFRFSAVSDQGTKNHTNAEATALAVRNPSALLHVRVFFD